MCLLDRFVVGAAILIAATVSAMASDGAQFGRPVTQQDIAAWDISIGPDGAGLPPGKGTVAQGEMVYAGKCQACHGEKGAGRPNDRLVGGMGSLAPDKGPPVKTVGSYWPYATTLFDYVRRAMPWDRPKSLSDEEVYSVAAYVLYLNGVIGQDDVIDAQSLPKVKMPNREGFTPFPRWPPPK
jgi:cytochrome c